MHEKLINWIASAKKDLLLFPPEVIQNFGYGLGFVQLGRTPENAKVLHRLESGVWELVENDADGTYRAVYAVRFEEVIYVLHCFQKKSRKGMSTPKSDMDLIRQRLASAKADYESRS